MGPFGLKHQGRSSNTVGVLLKYLWVSLSHLLGPAREAPRFNTPSKTARGTPAPRRALYPRHSKKIARWSAGVPATNAVSAPSVPPLAKCQPMSASHTAITAMSRRKASGSRVPRSRHRSARSNHGLHECEFRRTTLSRSASFSPGCSPPRSCPWLDSGQLCIGREWTIESSCDAAGSERWTPTFEHFGSRNKV